MAGSGEGNQVARRVLDDLILFSGETSIDGCINLFKSQQLAETRGFINRQREEAATIRNLVGQYTALIAEIQAEGNVGENFDTLMDLRKERDRANVKLRDVNDLIVNAEVEVEVLERAIEPMEG